MFLHQAGRNPGGTMQPFEKSKDRHAQRRRPAEHSQETAAQVPQGRRRSGTVLTLAGGVGVALIGIIAALVLRLDPPPQTIKDVAVVAMANLVAPPAPSSFGVADQGTSAQNDPLTTAVDAAMAQQGTGWASQDIMTATAARQIGDCVARLDRDLAPLVVQFDLDSAVITAQGAQLLTRISERIVTCEDAYVMVAGHAYGGTDDLTNLTLSWERADRTLNRLVELGVDPAVVEAVGFGARAPRSQGSVDEDSADRRVDFRVLRLRDGQL